MNEWFLKMLGEISLKELKIEFIILKKCEKNTFKAVDESCSIILLSLLAKGWPNNGV